MLVMITKANAGFSIKIGERRRTRNFLKKVRNRTPNESVDGPIPDLILNTKYPHRNYSLVTSTTIRLNLKFTGLYKNEKKHSDHRISN